MKRNDYKVIFHGKENKTSIRLKMPAERFNFLTILPTHKAFTGSLDMFDVANGLHLNLIQDG